MSRQRLAHEQWRELVHRQRDSGLTVEAFCRRQRLAASTFFAWRRRLALAGEPAFVEVTTKAGDATPASAPIELVLPGGVTVRVREGFDAATLRQIVEALS